MNEQFPSRRGAPFFHVGIIGGGQLGRMMIYRAKKLGMMVSVLDESDGAPAKNLADRFVRGSLYSEAAIRELASDCHVVTYEIEHLNADALLGLEADGIPVHPASTVLRTIQDKYVQKQALKDAGVAVPRFAAVDAASVRAGATEEIRAFGLPCVQKARTGGYDGRGVAVMRVPSDLAFPVPGTTMVEELVDVAREVAVIIARGRSGQITVYPLVEMRFRADANVLDWLEAPADIDPETADRVRSEAVKAVNALGGIGVFAVEMFVDSSGRVLVNEIAPRPHNSGHFTIEACVTDQFEQHLRAICGLPLGAVTQFAPAVTINLLGEDGYTGVPVVVGLDEILELEGVQFHWYGKSETRPNRKMGHVTVLGSTLEEARTRARRVQGLIRVIGEVTHG